MKSYILRVIKLMSSLPENLGPGAQGSGVLKKLSRV